MRLVVVLFKSVVLVNAANLLNQSILLLVSLVDGFNLTGLFGLANPFDVQQVEVLRGPQATELGVGALAGAIKFVSTAPGAEQGNQVLLSYGGKDTWRVGAAYGNDLSQRVGFRASWVSQGSDGEITNTFLNRDDTNNIREDAGRLALGVELGSRSDLLINYRYFDIDNGYDAFSLDNDSLTRSDQPGLIAIKPTQSVSAQRINLSHLRY